MAETSKLVKVQANFCKKSDLLFVEKNLVTSGGAEDIYGCADTLISKESPYVYISNFSRKPVTISAGQAISQGQDPLTWLDKEGQFMRIERDSIDAHTNLLRSIVNSEDKRFNKNPFAQTARTEI